MAKWIIANYDSGLAWGRWYNTRYNRKRIRMLARKEPDSTFIAAWVRGMKACDKRNGKSPPS